MNRRHLLKGLLAAPLALIGVKALGAPQPIAHAKRLRNGIVVSDGVTTVYFDGANSSTITASGSTLHCQSIRIKREVYL